LTGQDRSDYRPCPQDALEAILKHLRPPALPAGRGQGVHLLDPCAGDGHAIAQIAQAIQDPPLTERRSVNGGRFFEVLTNAIELNSTRARQITQDHPEIRLLGPCSLFLTDITPASMGFLFLNPPLNGEYGGTGGGYDAFLRRSILLLAPRGILCLVLPSSLVWGKRDVGTTLDAWFDRVEVYRFPRGAGSGTR
jgi:hypothetical protein